MAKTFGQVIADQRKALGRSLREVADRIDREDSTGTISVQYLNDIEHGRRNPPSEPILRQLARELKLDPDYLFVLASEFTEQDRRLIESADPQHLAEAWKAFRRTLGKKG